MKLEDIKKRRHEYYLANKSIILAKVKKYRESNRESILERKRLDRKNDPKKFSDQKKRQYLNNREVILKRNSEYRDRNKELYDARCRAYYYANRDRVLKRTRLYALKNKDKVRECQRRCAANRRAKSTSKRIEYNLRSRVRSAVHLQGTKKCDKTTSMLGCAIRDFKIYIESLWQTGMSWTNYGKGNDKWNLDHIIPCALFDLSRPEHQKRCFHFSNYQPLWETENREKGHKLTTSQFRLL